VIRRLIFPKAQGKRRAWLGNKENKIITTNLISLLSTPGSASRQSPHLRDTSARGTT
jgi:hypothetical protein